MVNAGTLNAAVMNVIMLCAVWKTTILPSACGAKTGIVRAREFALCERNDIGLDLHF